MTLIGIRIACVVFFAAILQVSAFSSVVIGGMGIDVLLVVLVSIALLRGSITGAITGFTAGIVVDVSTMGTLGITSLLLTLVGYWAGRYGETTGRSRPQAPLIAVLSATLFMALGGFALHSMLGESVSVRASLVPLVSALIINSALTYPVFACVRRLVGAGERAERGREIELLV